MAEPILRADSGIWKLPVPLCSVAIRTRNRSGYLREAVESVRRQSVSDWELLITDEASSDDTPCVCEELAAEDPRIRYVRHDPPLGQVRNWRYGPDHARGTYYATIDDDNRYLPDFLERMTAALEQEPNAVFAFCDEWRIDVDGSRLPRESDRDTKRYRRDVLSAGLHSNTVELALLQSPGINSTVFRRARLLELGSFRLASREFADFDIFISLGAGGASCAYVPERLAEYRIHREQHTADLRTNESKLVLTLSILDHYSFTGLDERLRRVQLALTYRGIGRTRLLRGDIRGARQALLQAFRCAPLKLKTLAAAGVLCLPAPAIRLALRSRYGANSSAP